ncbi:hypothetical protein [Thermus caliditerrae]|uniref:hypothetical protein n=1 Tax=Thermus caliditerrae TaxID=1330700 RepID=UPI00056F5A98|nr:hypothetical protein [Thermus caliditerrae]
MESAYAVYVDEYGETGGDLQSPGQPFHVLFATLVRAGSPYLTLEGALREEALRLAAKLGLRHLAPLHAVELYQRTGLYRDPPSGERLGVPEALEAFHAILEAIARGAAGFSAVWVEKQDLAERLGLRRGDRELGFRLRQALFALLLEEVNDRLEALNGYGFLFFETRMPEDLRFLTQAAPFEALRGQGGGFRLLGVPAPVGKGHLLMAAADFPAYVYGHFLKTQGGYAPRREDLWQAFQGLVQPLLRERNVGAVVAQRLVRGEG